MFAPMERKVFFNGRGQFDEQPFMPCRCGMAVIHEGLVTEYVAGINNGYVFTRVSSECLQSGFAVSMRNPVCTCVVVRSLAKQMLVARVARDRLRDIRVENCDRRERIVRSDGCTEETNSLFRIRDGMEACEIVASNVGQFVSRKGMDNALVCGACSSEIAPHFGGKCLEERAGLYGATIQVVVGYIDYPIKSHVADVRARRKVRFGRGNNHHQRDVSGLAFARDSIKVASVISGGYRWPESARRRIVNDEFTGRIAMVHGVPTMGAAPMAEPQAV
jgi:hypothetical protein